MAREKLPLTRVITVGEHHGRKFRNKYLVDGELVLDSFETEAKAKEAAKKFAKDHENETGPTVKARIEMWIEHRKSLGLIDRRCIRCGLANMLIEHMDDVATTITPKQMEDAYERLRGKITKYKRVASVATQQEALTWTKCFFRWLKEKGYVTKDPVAHIRPVGKRKKRKPQIETYTELFKFRDRAFALAEGGDRVALGVLVSLYNGPRSGEVRAIEARDVDQIGGNRVVIDGTKTENAYRSIRVRSPRLWNLLVAAAKAAQTPTERLVPHVQTTLLARVKHIGRDIGLPKEEANRLTFQSLRGMAASLATTGDAAAEAIANLLGQGDKKITNGHYATEASQLAAREQAAFRALEGGEGTPDAGVASIANQTQPEQQRATA
jgi:integrase